MGHADYLRNGDYNAICDRCGSKFKFSQLKLEWDGLYVCTANGCFENRQPQDYVKGVRDNMSVPISRPQSPNVFLAPIIVTEIPIITLSFIKALLKSLAVSVTSACSIIPIKYPKTTNTSVVNGFSLNTTTLG